MPPGAAALPAASAGCSRDGTSLSTAAYAASATPTPPAAAMAPADIGKPAPDFTLADVDGHSVHLADYRGKVVVLEWSNPKRPFVTSRTPRSRSRARRPPHRRRRRGLAIHSSAAAARQRRGRDPRRRDRWSRHPILRDESGVLGHTYAPRTRPTSSSSTRGVRWSTPEPSNSPDARRSPQGGPLVNYVDAASRTWPPVDRRHAEDEAYGCGVDTGR